VERRKNVRRAPWILLAVALGLLVLVPVADAYAPPPHFVLGLSVGKRSKQKLEAIQVTLRRTDYADGQPGQPVEVTVTYRQGGKVRREWTDAAGRHVRLSDGARLLTVDGETRAVGRGEANLLDALWAVGPELADRDLALDRALDVLRAWGVADQPVSYARMEGRIAWVVGAEPRAVEVPQVWVDKDEFLPLRFIHAPGVEALSRVRTDGGVAYVNSAGVVERTGKDPGAPDGGAAEPVVMVDERLRGWGSALGGEFYPSRVETWRGGVLVRVEELVKVDVTPKLEEKDFKVE
jgi:hypothetical protein